MNQPPFAALVYRHEKTVYPCLTVGVPRDAFKDTQELAKLLQNDGETVSDFFGRVNAVMRLYAERGGCDMVELEIRRR